MAPADKKSLPGLGEGSNTHYLTLLAYSVGVMPNLSLNCREKWCTVEFCSAAAISVKFMLSYRILFLLSGSLIRRMYSPGEICRFFRNRAVK